MPDQSAALIARDLLVALINAKLILPETTSTETAQTVGESYCIIYRALAAVLDPAANKSHPPPTATDEQRQPQPPRRLSKPTR